MFTLRKKRPLALRRPSGLVKHDGVRGDAEQFQGMIRKDKDKELVYKLNGYPWSAGNHVRYHAGVLKERRFV